MWRGLPSSRERGRHGPSHTGSVSRLSGEFLALLTVHVGPWEVGGTGWGLILPL